MASQSPNFADSKDAEEYNDTIDELNKRIEKILEAEREINKASNKEIDESEDVDKEILRAIRDLRNVVEPRYKNMMLLNLEANNSFARLMRIVGDKMLPGDFKMRVIDEIGEKVRDFENIKARLESIDESLREIKLMERGLVLAMAEAEEKARAEGVQT